MSDVHTTEGLREFLKKRVIFISGDDNAKFFPDRHVQSILDAFRKEQLELLDEVEKKYYNENPHHLRLDEILAALRSEIKGDTK